MGARSFVGRASGFSGAAALAGTCSLPGLGNQDSAGNKMLLTARTPVDETRSSADRACGGQGVPGRQGDVAPAHGKTRDASEEPGAVDGLHALTVPRKGG